MERLWTRVGSVFCSEMLMLISECLRLTEEQLQTDQTADETVKVDGKTGVSVPTHDLLDHGAVQLEP